MNHRTILAALAAPLLAMPALAHAQDAPASSDAEASGPFTIDAEVGAFTDYRFRGLSLSGREPEITASLSVSHESGLYASAWFSNVELGNGKANNLEMDWTAGYSKDVGGVTLDAGAIYYSYLSHSDLNYIEVYGSIGTKVGPADMKVGVAYAPSQSHIGNRDNTYVYISGDVPIKDTPLSVHGSFGFEDGAFGDKKKDWLVGASYDMGAGFTATLDYVDTAHAQAVDPLGKATAVFSIKKSF